MPTRDNAPTGAPCWVDLITSDTERSRAFYCELFGWTAEEPAEEFGGYINFQKSGVRVAGCMASRPGTEPSDVWNVYLTTDDATKTVEATVAEGGQVVVEPMAVGDLGTMAYVTDSSGAVVGIWQPGRHAGFGVFGETGTPAWFELNTRDHDSAVSFYRNIFRLDSDLAIDTPEMRYTTLQHGDEQLAGVMDATDFLPEGVPPHWAVYFAVDDCDAALAKAVELGGTIVAPAQDTPYGRLAAATDPTGAQFKLVAPNEAMPPRD